MDAVDSAPGTRARALGSRYVLGRLLGAGAMGEVWEATDQRSGELVAAKLLRQEYARDPEIVARFVQERAILLDLVHPNVVRVRDLVVEGDALALVMDLVRGSDLRAVLRGSGTLPAAEALRIVVDVLSGLAEAHARGVLHRDVKPDNVLVDSATPPRVLLSDFGIARLAQETTVRMTGVLGTAEYMAPEVFTAETVSPASDVYGAGIMLYELLAGRTPFAGGGTGYAVANRHVTAAPPAVPGLPARLEAVLTGMLAKDPTRRPTAAGAAEALQALQDDVAGLAALPVLAAPSQWTPVAVAPGGVEVRGAAAAADVTDLGRTSVKAARPADAGGPAAEAPADWAGVPQVDEEVAAGHTQLRTRERPAAPQPQPAPAEPPAAPWWRRPVVLGSVGAVLVAALLAGGVALLDGGDNAPAPDTTATAEQAPSRELVTVAAPVERLPSGLQVAREGSYDAEAGTLTTTITWSAGDAALGGPFFEAVPPAAEGGACPDAVWDVVAVRDATPGVAAGTCGWQVQVSQVAARSEARAVVTVPFAPDGDDVLAAVRTHLAEQVQLTGEALDGIVASPVYPAQRLEALEVQLVGSVRVGAPVEALVLPVWRGTDAADNVDVLHSSRSPRPNALLQQLGGTVDLRSDDCSGAIAATEGALYADTVAQRCTLTVRIGDVEGRSRTFDVLQNTAG